MYRWIFYVLVICFFVSCSNNNVTIDNSIYKYFDSAHTNGSFGLFNNSNGQFTVYNMADFKDSTHAPGASFDIVLALAALQTGAIANEHALIKDSLLAPVTARQAFTQNATPYFQQLARQMGKDTLQKWIDTIGYGQRYKKFIVPANAADTFWLNGSLGITADEQLGLVKKLYFDQLPFFKSVQKNVRDWMQQEQNANYRLSYLGNSTGAWTLGWIEENKHPYFFVLYQHGTANGIEIVKQILKSEGFFEGRK